MTNQSSPKPLWLRKRASSAGSSADVRATLQESGLHTVCAEAKCPNQMECINRGTATFLLLGPDCTRRCTFCAVGKSRVQPADPGEPERIAKAIAHLGLDYCVLTMVTRDDLPDGGASHVVETISAIRKKVDGIKIEVLISDMDGNIDALDKILEVRPEVLNHNIETVQRLYQDIRPLADYHRSLDLLARASSRTPPLITKSGIMVGIGETRDEVIAAIRDIRSSGCRLLTIGQYLAPSEKHHPVIRYVHPDEFEDYRNQALMMGFSAVVSSPFVRSSFNAKQLYEEALHNTEPFDTARHPREHA